MIVQISGYLRSGRLRLVRGIAGRREIIEAHSRSNYSLSYTSGLTMSEKEVPAELNAGSEAPAEHGDAAAPSELVSSRQQSLSDIFTIFCAGFALISDGYQNNLMYRHLVVEKPKNDYHWLILSSGP